MAEVKPLKLRAEKINIRKAPLSEDPYISVIVATPFLDSTDEYCYRLVEGSQEIQVGDLVSVPFGSLLLEAVVCKRSSTPTIEGEIRDIHGVISRTPTFSPRQIALSQRLAKRYAAKTWDFLRVSAPEFSKSGEASFIKNASRPRETFLNSSDSTVLPSVLSKHLSISRDIRDVVTLPPYVDPYRILAEVALTRNTFGKSVIVLPDMKDLLACEAILKAYGVTPRVLHAQLKKSERFHAYLEANSAKKQIVLSLRNGVFLDLQPSDTLIVYDEVESHHYERRSPSWNSRDVALLRSADSSVIFLSHSPSLELVQQVHKGWFTLFNFPAQSLKGISFLNSDGTEPSLHRMIERGLWRGNVLISVPAAGYINGFSCRRCRSMALCECGNRLSINREGAIPECSLCNKRWINWRCLDCDGTSIWAFARGVERTAVEFAKSFPNTRVIRSSGDSQIATLPDGPNIVFATAGSEPISSYSAIMVLGAEERYSRVGLRAQEEMKLQLFKLISFLIPDGTFYLSLPSHHEVSQGLTRYKPFDLAERELAQRLSPQLPPYFRTVLVKADYSDLEPIAQALKARDISTFFLGVTSKSASRLLVKFAADRGEEVATFFLSIQRIRSVQRKPLLGLKFDSFTIE